MGDVSEAVELELGLGLSLGGGAWGLACGRILTAGDFPSVGSKRGAETVSHEPGASPPRSSQVMGWPPIGIHRMNSLINQSKSLRSEEGKERDEDLKRKSEEGDEPDYSGEEEDDDHKIGDSSKKKFNQRGKERMNSGFVKVNLDGIPIGRKVDLNAHSCYESLAVALEDMFFGALIGSCSEKEKGNHPKLLHGLSDFVLTYEDKEGDWMLVGDVPWRMFLGSVRRLRIMQTSEANGLII